MGNFYSGTEARLYTGSKSMATKIMLAAASYGLTEELATEFRDATLDFETRYLAAKNPATRTTPQIQAKNASKAVLKKLCVDLAKIITGTPTTTNEQLADLGLNIRKPRERYGPPTERPGIDVESVFGRTIVTNIHDSTSSAKRGKPTGSVQALVYYFVGETYPSDPTGWSFAGPATKGKFQFTLPETVPGGSLVWICAAWTNRAGEPGPTNVPISTNIQGGGSSSATAELKIAA